MFQKIDPLMALIGVIFAVVNSMAVASVNVVPIPVSLVEGEGEFHLFASTKVFIAPELGLSRESIRLLLEPATGFSFESVKESGAADIRVVYDSNRPAEGYRLQVTESEIDISASTDAGVFYALQTLRQLLPAAIYGQRPVQQDWNIPAVEIEDEPRFQWRGLHLDVGRHFMPVAFIKKYVDLLAVHKMNTFHWHLTEDQGWRIEIKRYPKLTQMGSVRAQTVIGNPLFKDVDELQYDGIPHAGFYTQEEVRDVVAYAQARHVTIVPEIEFPGHAQAAIAAYPELGNTGKQLKVRENWGISKNTIKPSEETLAFYRNVLAEVLALFPSEYIHIGGDEAPRGQWETSEFAQKRIQELGLKDADELQSWLIQQMADFLTANGRKLIGWDEIMQGGLSNNASVMSWRGMKRGIKAAEAGHDVVMAPTGWTYLDYYQADSSVEPLAIGSYLPLRKVYAFDPAPASMPVSVSRHILGAQGQLWTEFMKTPDDVEYMAYPRGAALAEVVWSPQSRRSFEDFQARLEGHLERLDVLQVNYRPPGNDELTFKGKIKQGIFNLGVAIYHWFSEL